MGYVLEFFLVDIWIITLKTECYACSLNYTQFGNSSALVIEFHSLINSYHTIEMKVYFKALTHYAGNCKDFPKRIREKIVAHVKNC